MSTDLERELRELFHDKAGEAPVVTPDVGAGAPRQVLRRGRLHQIGTVAGTASVVLALVVGSVAGMSSLLRGGGEIGAGGYDVFERTATIEAFSLSSPSDWYLVNDWPRSMHLAVGSGSASETCTVDPSGNQACASDPEAVDPIHPPLSGLAMLQLSNVDLGLSSNACRDGLPSGAAALYIALDPAADAGALDPFPPGPMPGMPAPSSDGPCGPGSYSRFTVNGIPMFSWVGWAAGASEEDRATVQTTWEQMWAHDDWTPSQPAHDTPAYVLAGGGRIGDEWRLELRPSETNVELTLIGALPLDALPGVAVPQEPIEWCCGAELTDPIFGAITKEATGVEFRPGTQSTDYDLGGSPVPGTILPVPPTLGSFGFDLFFIDPPEGYADLGGHVLALGLEGSPSVAPPLVAEPRAESVELTGSFAGQDWSVRFIGRFADGTACVQPLLGEEGLQRMCPRPMQDTLAGRLPYLSGWLTSFYLLAGTVPPEVVEVRLAGDDGVVPQQFRCEMGPLGWTDPDKKVCAIALPSSGSGTLRYLDADGDVVFEEGIGWGEAEPDEVPMTTVATAGSLEMTAGRSLEEGLCLEIPDRSLVACSLAGPPLTTAVLQGTTVQDLSNTPAILIWGAVPSEVGRIQIRGDTFFDELMVGDATHEAFPGISFVLYAAPRAEVGDPCDLQLVFIDQDGNEMGPAEALGDCAA
jgi:hypothetical protein